MTLHHAWYNFFHQTRPRTAILISLGLTAILVTLLLIVKLPTTGRLWLAVIGGCCIASYLVLMICVMPRLHARRLRAAIAQYPIAGLHQYITEIHDIAVYDDGLDVAIHLVPWTQLDRIRRKHPQPINAVMPTYQHRYIYRYHAQTDTLKQVSGGRLP